MTVGQEGLWRLGRQQSWIPDTDDIERAAAIVRERGPDADDLTRLLAAYGAVYSVTEGYDRTSIVVRIPRSHLRMRSGYGLDLFDETAGAFARRQPPRREWLIRATIAVDPGLGAPPEVWGARGPRAYFERWCWWWR